MRTLLILLLLCTPAFAYTGQQRYVKAQQAISEESAPEAIVVTQAMKNAALAKIDAQGYITVQDVKVIIKGNRTEAEKVIQDFIDAGNLKTYEQRYTELYPGE